MNKERLEYMKRAVSNELIMPFSVELHPTNGCNQDCVWCIMRDIRKKGEKLSHAQLLKIAIELYENKQTKQVFLSGGGDPLTSSELFDEYEFEGKRYNTYFELLYKLDLYPSLSTNGENLSRLLESNAYKYIDELRVSIDAGTEEQYAKLHRSKRGISLQSIIENIENYYRVSGKKIRISYLLHPINKDGYIQLTNSFHFPDAVSKINVKPLAGDEDFEYRDDIVENGIQICFEKPKEEQEMNFSTHTHIVICADGNFYPCCHSIDFGEQFLLGNIDNTRIDEAIIGKYSFISRMWNCKKCAALEINKIFNVFYKMEKKND